MMRTATLWRLLIAVLCCAAPALASSGRLELRPEATKVTFLLVATGHDVHGSLPMLSGTLVFDDVAGSASGEIRLDPKTAETGSDSRDETMKEKVFEVAQFPTIEFLAKSLRGTIPASGSGRVTLEGTLRLHGGDHPFALPAELTRKGDELEIKTSFVVPYQEWGLHDPSILFLRVAKEVTVTVEAKGRLTVDPEPVGDVEPAAPSAES